MHPACSRELSWALLIVGLLGPISNMNVLMTGMLSHSPSAAAVKAQQPSMNACCSLHACFEQFIADRGQWPMVRYLLCAGSQMTADSAAEDMIQLWAGCWNPCDQQSFFTVGANNLQVISPLEEAG